MEGTVLIVESNAEINKIKGSKGTDPRLGGGGSGRAVRGGT
jgi:hypothetical protein